MLTKKLRSISMVCLALVMALSLCFGIANFSNVKSASAATNTEIAYDGASATAVPSSAWTGELSGITVDWATTAGSNSYNVTGELSGTYLCIKYDKATSSNTRGAKITIPAGVVATVSLYFTAGSSGRYVAFLDAYGTPTSSNGMNVSTSKTVYLTTFSTTGEETADTVKYICGSNSWHIAKLVIESEPLVTNYTVSFDTDGGSDVAAETVEEGKTLTAAPTAPTKTGYNFLGWSTDGSTVIDDITTVTINSDTTFKAVWELDASFVKPSITEYDAVSNVEIDFGTAIDAIELPAEVTSGEYSFPVTWTWDKEYDATVLQNYTLTGNVEVDADVYDVTAAAPTMQVIVKEIAVASQTLEGIYYTFDNANVLGLPATIAVSGVDFEISWNAYVADSAAITGSLVAKTGYDVSNATVTANVEYVTTVSKSINFINDGISSGTEYNSILEAAGYSVTGTWSYEKSESNVSDDYIEYMGIKGNLATITMYLDKPATVTIAAAGNSSSALTLDGATVKSGTQAVMVKSYELEAGAHTLESTVSGKNIFIKFINIQYEDSTEFIGYSNSKFSAQSDASATLPLVAGEKAGYEFIGWTNGNGLYAPGADITDAETEAKASGNGYMGTIYTAVYAKAEYLGISFRKSAESPAVRFGYVVTIVDANENALNGLTLNASAVFNVANLTNGSSANVNVDVLNIAYNENQSGYLANLSITGIDSAKAQNALNVDMTITINGVSIIAESDATESDTIVSKAQKLYDAGQLTDAQAEIYGVVLNG